MKPKKLLMFLGILLVTASATMLLLGANKKAHENADVGVIVASEDIEKGTAITEKMITYKSEPKNRLIPGAITDKRKIVGKIVNSNIYKYDYILEQHITKEAKSDPDTRIISLPVALDDGAVGVKKGDIVDIFSINKQDRTASLLLPAVRILEVRTRSNEELSGGQAIKNGIPAYISFEVKFGDINEVLKAKITDVFYVARYGEYSSPEIALEAYKESKAKEQIKQNIIEASNPEGSNK